MLDGVPASAITQPVEFSDNSLFKGFNVNSNLIENGQDYAVIPLFDDAHKALGRDRYEQINTIAGHSANTSPKNISFTIKFSNPISVDELNINKLNVFIFVEGNRNQRKEIHIVGYQQLSWQIQTCLEETTTIVLLPARDITSAKITWHGESWFRQTSNGLWNM